MAKKKGKKKKGKGGKDKKKGLSNLEREIFLLTIGELEHKIEWRNHMCNIIEEDIKQYSETCDLQRKDKEDAVELLEGAIREQKQICESIQRAIPEAENSKSQVEERRARELASKLMQMNEEKLSYDEQLGVLKKNLKSLEAYIPDKVDGKIKDIEEQLELEDADGTFIKGVEQDKRREEAIGKEMQDILANVADSFQEEISGKLDKNFERITEETRWWADMANGLRITTERLEALNRVNASNVRAAQKHLTQRKELSLQASYRLQEGEAFILELIRRNREQEDTNKAEAQLQKDISILNEIAVSLKQNLDAQENHFIATFEKMKQNENEFKMLQENLSNEILFGRHLSQFIKKAGDIVTKEVKYSLILTYDGPPEKNDTLEELRCLFEEATKFIYDRKNKSLL